MNDQHFPGLGPDQLLEWISEYSSLPDTKKQLWSEQTEPVSLSSYLTHCGALWGYIHAIQTMEQIIQNEFHCTQ